MPHKQLGDITIFQWIATTVVSIWAVLVAFIEREFTKQTSFKKKLYFFFQDFIVSGGTTYIVFIACMGYGLPDTFSIPIAGYIGHKATKFSYLLEKYIEKRLNLPKEI